MKKMNLVRRFGPRVLSATTLGLVTGAAFAAGPTYDVSTATSAISAGGVAIAALGVAALVLIIGLKVWKRLRGAA
jgi:predicted phage tail protein